uniref:Calcineurin-like phosphoesterase domain-containing protein n=1 Tax=Rhodosorus marinus TaxID=101924 RepID=A0A7S3E611_9RHOD|mmetsp:Transcript_1152/g.3238  ORF Transcript_1152/g.3238 Transcript_1152/m.3238 type:complete len:329 (+) Transcript_1152:382-1368(+)
MDGHFRWDLARDRGFHGIPDDDEGGNGFQPFHFVVLADTQFGMITNNGSVDEEVERVQKAVDAINLLKPMFVIVCGDLINAHPDIYEDLDEQTELYQVSTFKRVMSEIHDDIPLVCVCGNHDVGNRPTPEYIDRYKARFGDDYFSFTVRGVKFIVLNNQLYSDPSGALDAFNEQHEWFEAELKRASVEDARHIVVFSHIPWFIYTADEPDELPNEAKGEQSGMPPSYFHIPRENRLMALLLMRHYGVRACFTGHWHRNWERTSLGINLVITCAAGMPLDSDDKWGYRIVKVLEDKLEHKYFESDDKVPRLDFEVDATPGWSCLGKQRS